MVRLPKEPFWTRRTIVNFASSVAAGVIIMLVWWLWPIQRPKQAYQRDLTEVTVSWSCPRKHTFEAVGQIGSRPCPTCGDPAEIELTYTCPEHGPVAVKVRYRKGSHGRSELDRYSLDGVTWFEIQDGLMCPRCGMRLLSIR